MPTSQPACCTTERPRWQLSKRWAGYGRWHAVCSASAPHPPRGAASRPRVVCTDDRTVAPDLQRVMAGRADESIEWDSDHSPNASRPREVAALLTEIAHR